MSHAKSAHGKRNQIAVLLPKLIRDLTPIRDAHGVCAAAAETLSRVLDLVLVVAVADSEGRNFDAWISRPGQDVAQARWKAQSPSTDPSGQEETLRTARRGTAEFGQGFASELWALAEQSIALATLPFDEEDEAWRRWFIALIDPPESNQLEPGDWSAIARLVGLYLERALLRQRSDRQAIEFGIVSDISRSITASLDLNEIMREVTEAVGRALGVDSVSIGLVDDEAGELIFVSELMGPLFLDLPPLRLKLGQGIAGWVAQRGQPTIVNHPYDDSRFFAKADQDSGFRTDSVLCAPLTIEKRIIGVLEAVNKRSGPFNEHDLQLVMAIAGSLAVAIDNARQHGRVLAEKRRMAAVFANMSEGLLTVDQSGRITSVNDALLSLLKRPGTDLVGKPLGEVIRVEPGGLEEFAVRVRSADREAEYPQVACDLIQADGSALPVLISGATVPGLGGEGAVSIFVFSDLRQIREVERMRDDFFGSVIHQLYAPLATILMYARLLREGHTEGDPNRAERFLGVIERESDRLQRMIRQMLRLASLESVAYSRSSGTVDLKAVLEQVLAPLAAQANDKGLAFRQRVPDDLPAVAGSSETLHMVFWNLIENSVKFSYAGTIQLTVSREDSHVIVEILDEGIGIPKEAQPNMFRRFYRAQPAVERGIAGSGLGLYMVREGLKKSGGEIELESEPGRGTRVIVRLPIADE